MGDGRSKECESKEFNSANKNYRIKLVQCACMHMAIFCRWDQNRAHGKKTTSCSLYSPSFLLVFLFFPFKYEYEIWKSVCRKRTKLWNPYGKNEIDKKVSFLCLQQYCLFHCVPFCFFCVFCSLCFGIFHPSLHSLHLTFGIWSHRLSLYQICIYMCYICSVVHG